VFVENDLAFIFHVPAQQSEAVFFQKRLLFLDVAKPAQQSEAVFFQKRVVCEFIKRKTKLPTPV
jgi:hypothetical protein